MATPGKAAEQQHGADADPEREGASVGSANKGLGLGMGFLRKMLPEGFVPKYFASEWSLAQVRGIEGRSICAFVGDATQLAVVCADGSFVLSSFDEGGDCPRLAYHHFVRDGRQLEQQQQQQHQQP